MRKPLRLGLAVCLILKTLPAVADCEAGGHADPPAAAAKTASTTPEYATGEPKVLEVEDAGEIKQVPYVKVDSLAVFEGDIVLGNADQFEFAAQSGPVRLQARTTADPSGLTPFGLIARSVLSGARKWTNNTIPYVIDPRLSSRDILRAMKAWENTTNLNFVERTAATASDYPDYVYFTIGSGHACLSRGVGKVNGRQNVELIAGCEYGQIIHEIGHVIGLSHEQNRADRDSHVRVQMENILRGYAGQFMQRTRATWDAGPYDLDSIMHYEPYAFSCNGKPTIVPVNPLRPGVRLGQRDHVSAGDAAVVNSAYK